MPQTIVDLGKLVKSKYPGSYDDMADDQLGQMVKSKYPGSYDDFSDTPASAIEARIAKTKAGLATQSQYNDTTPSLVGGFQSEMQKNPIISHMFPPAINPATGHSDPYGVERGVAMTAPLAWC